VNAVIGFAVVMAYAVILLTLLGLCAAASRADDQAERDAGDTPLPGSLGSSPSPELAEAEARRAER